MSGRRLRTVPTYAQDMRQNMELCRKHTKLLTICSTQKQQDTPIANFSNSVYILDRKMVNMIICLNAVLTGIVDSFNDHITVPERGVGNKILATT